MTINHDTVYVLVGLRILRDPEYQAYADYLEARMNDGARRCMSFETWKRQGRKAIAKAAAKRKKEAHYARTIL